MSEIKEGYLRVTAMLSPFSGLSQVPGYILDNKKKLGTEVHRIISGIEAGLGEPVARTDIKGYLESYKKWACGRVLLTQINRFYDDSLMITGEIDSIYEEDGPFVIVDYKTSLKESKSWPIQATAYSYLAKKNGYDVKRVEFVKLDKTGKEPKVFCYEENMELFLKVLDTYRYFFGNKNHEEIMDY